MNAQKKLTRTQQRFVQKLRDASNHVCVVRGKVGVGKTTCIMSLSPVRIQTIQQLATKLAHACILPHERECTFFYIDAQVQTSTLVIPDNIAPKLKEKGKTLFVETSEKLKGTSSSPFSEFWLEASYESECKRLVPNKVASHRLWKSFFSNCHGNLHRLFNVHPQSYSNEREWACKLFDGCKRETFQRPKQTKMVVDLCMRNIPGRCTDIQSASYLYDTLNDYNLYAGAEVSRTLAETAILASSIAIRRDYKPFHKCSKCEGIFSHAKTDRNKRKYVSCQCSFYNPLPAAKRMKRTPAPTTRPPTPTIHCCLCSKPLYTKQAILEHDCACKEHATVRDILGKNIPLPKDYPQRVTDSPFVAKTSFFLPRKMMTSRRVQDNMVTRFRNRKYPYQDITSLSLMRKLIREKLHGKPLTTFTSIEQADVAASHWKKGTAKMTLY